MTENAPVTTARRTSRRRKGRVVPRLVVGGSVALLLTAGVLGYRASAEPAQARYRTVVAGPATVAQTISLSGTVRHVSQVSASFPTGGMVVSVAAKAGDTVAAGQPLATIDSGPLQNAVLDAEAAWRNAVAKLDTDQTAYDAASAATSTTTSTTKAPAAAGAARPTSAGAGGPAAPSRGSAAAPSGADSARPSASVPAVPSGSTKPSSGGSASAPAGQPSGSVRPPSGAPSSGVPGSPSGSVTPPPGSAAPVATVQDAAKSAAALQHTLDSIDANFEAFVVQCLPAGLPSTMPSIASAWPSVVTVTATKTVTATRTVTVTAPPTSPGSSSSSSTTTATGQALAAGASPSGTPSTTRVTPSTAPSTTGQGVIPSGFPVSPACQQAMQTLASLPHTLSTQLADVQTTMLGAQAGLTAQAAALQAQAAQLQQQGAAIQGQAAALQQQAAALQQQAAALQGQAAAMQAQAAAAAAQGAAAAAKLGAAGAVKVSEATLITDRANVEATALALQQAKDRLSGATVTSPIAGVVASLPWVAGQSATATSAAIIIGPGAIEITVPVALAQRPQVEVGQAATVTSPVSQTPLEAKVSRIGLLPVSTTSSAAAAAAAAGAAAAPAGTTTTTNVSYPVIVTVPSLGDALPEGSRVQVGIVTAKVAAPVTVPSSAVTPTSLTAGTLQVLVNGVAERRTVQIGISGGGTTQVVSGVSAGEAVVVADMELPLPGVTIATGRQSQQPSQANQGQLPQGQQGGQQPGQGQPTR